MKKYLVSLTALLALTGLALFAADIDGTWTMTKDGKDGKSQTTTITLMSKGSALTGKFDGGRGGAVDISDGKVDGNSVSFKVVRNFNGKEFAQEYKGTVKGSELTIDAGRGAQTFKKQ
jgi:hypothetical protein